jgi:hypothetical protein
MPDENTVNLIEDNTLFSPGVVDAKHEEMLSSFKVPTWVLDDGKRCCAECGEVLSPSSVREVGFCLNPQNIGDIQVEIMCKSCYSGYYILFRKACKDFHGFSAAVNPALPKPDSIGEPVRSSQLSAKDNNLTDAIVADERGKTDKETQCQ